MKYIRKGYDGDTPVLEWRTYTDFEEAAYPGDAVRIHTNYAGSMSGRVKEVGEDRVKIMDNRVDTVILFSTITGIMLI